MMHTKTLAAIYLSSLLASGAFAAVSPEEAARLGKDLTPMGAERAGNADGSIPEWGPDKTVIPENFVPGSDNYVSPYSDQKPLYTVDVNNWKEYADVLTEGAKGLLEKLGPAGFKMNVYPTGRTSEAPDWI